MGEQPYAGSAEQPLQFGRLKVLSIGDILNAPARSYLLKGLISPAEYSVWWGPPKCGKTFLMLFIAYSIAQGREIFGRRVHPTSVLYVAAEGEAGLATRLRAIREVLGDAPSFHLIAQPVDLLHDGGNLEEVKKAALHPTINARLIVLDTLNRMMAGGDENSPHDMGTFIANVGELRKETGAHVAAIHHGTKNPNGSTPRGHGSLIGAADLVVEIAKSEDGSRSAKVTAAKDDPDGATLGFTLKVIDMGTDEDGDPITTCLAEEASFAPTTEKTKLTTSERTAKQYLADLLVSEGVSHVPGTELPPGLLAVPESRWRDECDSRRLSTAEKKDDRSKAFRRAYSGLQSKAIIGTRNGVVWLTRPPLDQL